MAGVQLDAKSGEAISCEASTGKIRIKDPFGVLSTSDSFSSLVILKLVFLFYCLYYRVTLPTYSKYSICSFHFFDKKYRFP